MRIVARLFVAVVVLVIWLAIYGTAHTQEITQLSGTVLLNGGPAPANQMVTVVSSEGEDCGTTSIGDGGSYSLELKEECPPDETVQFFLGDRETGLLADEQVTLTGGAQQVDIFFTTTGADQQADQVAEIEETRAEALIQDRHVFLLLFAVIVGTVVLLAFMVWSYKNVSREEREDNYRRQVEGLVLLMVVVAIIILGVTGKITPEGLTAILGAITGYAIGQARGAAAAGRQPTPTEGAAPSPSKTTGEATSRTVE